MTPLRISTATCDRGVTDPEPEVEVSDRDLEPDELAQFEDELVAIVADVIVARRSVAA